MSKRMWTGLLVGLVAALALVTVGVGAYHAGERHSVTVAPVAGDVGETVRVVGDGHWGPWGGPPFGFLFPLLIIGIVALLIAGRRRTCWAGPEGALAEWHRRAHSEPEATGTPGEAPPGTA